MSLRTLVISCVSKCDLACADIFACQINYLGLGGCAVVICAKAVISKFCLMVRD